MGSTGNRRRDGGHGLSIRTAQEMRQTEKAVDEDPPPPPSTQVFVPGPSEEDRYQVLVYSKEHGAFIHRCYATSLEDARRSMGSEEALGHRVKCQELLRFDRGVTTSAVEPPEDPRVERLQSHLKAVWKAQGRAETALPTSMEKLEAMLREVVLLDQGGRR
jgi:hypothetical protein